MRNCPVGRITFICSSSRELSPRRKSVAGCLNRAAARFAMYQPPDVGRIVRRRVGYLDTSGKSPAYHHHRKNFKARAGKLAAGFLNRTAAAFFGACHSSYVSSSSQDVSRRAAVRTIKPGMISSENRFPLFRKSDRAVHVHPRRGQHDRLSDIARAGWLGRDRGVGGTRVSAAFFRLISRSRNHRSISILRAKLEMHSSCPGLSRAPTSYLPGQKTWMAGTSPAMTSSVAK
jgi:hypothetical protein